MKKKQLKSIVLIGNGFDKAHGLKTGYNDFVKNNNSDAVLYFHKLVKKYLPPDCCWYEFENAVNALTMRLFIRKIEFNKPIKNMSINSCFNIIRKQLIKYLRNETSKDFKLLDSIKPFLTDAYIINFNYTSTAEKYNCKPYYIHGSIDEEEAVLGYDYRAEPCLISYGEMFWNKAFRRDTLLFSRFLSSFIKSPKIRRVIIKRFEIICDMENSARGEIFYENTVFDYIIRFYKFVSKIQKEKRLIPDYNIKFDDVKQIVVIGHSLEADEHLLHSMLEKCSSLKRVIIFTYKGEPQKDIKAKMEFFKTYNVKIALKNYD